MDKDLVAEFKKLMGYFPKSYINNNFELILISKTNTYFCLEDCKERKDIVAKLLMWCTRTIVKGQPYKSKNRNALFKHVVKSALNGYLGTMFSDEDVDLIYQKLGNGINPELTYRFIDSGFDLEVLND